MDGLAHVLHGADGGREETEEHHGVQVTDAVRPVVVLRPLEPGEAREAQQGHLAAARALVSLWGLGCVSRVAGWWSESQEEVRER